MSKWKYGFLLLSLLLLSANTAFAAPSVSIVTGDVVDGEAVTIGGTDFGTKSTAAPTKWDNFNSGTPGGNIEGWTAWSTEGVVPKYTNTSRNSSVAIVCDFTTGNQYNCTFGRYETITNYYVSYWTRITTSEADSRNVKPFRLYGSNDRKPAAGYTDQMYNGWAYIWANGVDYNPNLIWSNSSYDLDDNDGNWHRYEYYLEQSGNGVADGVYKFFKDGVQVQNRSGITFRYTNDYWSQLVIGHYYARNDGHGNSSAAYFYYDDVYVDTVEARIEIGNNSDFASCTHREIQIASAWSTTSATATVNRGSFAADAEAYLFVIDSDGVASPGHPISFGASSPADAIAPVIVSTSPQINFSLSADLTINSTDAVGVVALQDLTFNGVSEVGDASSSGTDTDKIFTLANADIDTTLTYSSTYTVGGTLVDTAANENGFSFDVSTNPDPVAGTEIFSTGALGDLDNWTETAEANWTVADDDLIVGNVYAASTGVYPEPFPGGSPSTIMSYDVTLSGGFVLKINGKIETQIGTFGDIWFSWGGNGTATGRTQNFVQLDTFTDNSFYGSFDTSGVRTITDWFQGTSIPADDTWYEWWLEVDGVVIGDGWRIKRDGATLYEGTNAVSGEGRIAVGTNDVVGFDGPTLIGVEQPPVIEDPPSVTVKTTVTRSGGLKTTITRNGDAKVIIQ